MPRLPAWDLHVVDRTPLTCSWDVTYSALSSDPTVGPELSKVPTRGKYNGTAYLLMSGESSCGIRCAQSRRINGSNVPRK